MVLEIKKYPNPGLKKRAKEVEGIDGEVRKLVSDMLETMYACQGVGLAAPQVGVQKRVFVTDTGSGPRVFINPKILKKYGKEYSEEGCLSVPGDFLKIKRAKSLEIEALNLEGKKFKIKASGLLAKAIQQEMDHLDGILIIDRLGFWQKLKRKIFRHGQLRENKI
ncbi:MAG: peptide deformylase [bacterium]|nr:peptide deformylase [bacterium]